MAQIKKAIIPVAGFGTRFLPATKAQPKEMLPIVDKPIIQYLVEEAVAAGIEEIIFVTGRGKRAIEDHFDCSFELEHTLVEKNKTDRLEAIYNISNMAKFSFVRQPKPLGDGDALLRARHLIGDEPCAVLFGDDIVDAEKPCIGQLMDVFYKYESPVLALMEVPKEEVSSFGVVGATKVEDRVYAIKELVEKPKMEEAPSNLVVASRYILTPDIFGYIDASKPGKGGEIQITDALRKRVADGHPMFGCRVQAVRHDAGNTLDFIKTNILYALEREDLAPALREFIVEQADSLRRPS